jgi:hypothetical protein
METGEKIYVESLLTDEEWKENYKKYSTCILEKKPKFFDSEFKWRYRMGGGLTPAEITLMNTRLEKIRKDAGLKKEANEQPV